VYDGECAILACVGEGMAHKKGVARTLFRALAQASVNVIAIAQGSSGTIFFLSNNILLFY